jgi:hypothetical protein
VRYFFLVLSLALALPAAAQPALTDAARVSRLLGAIWRPLPTSIAGAPEAAFRTACEGALEEMAALDLSLPEHLTPEALAPVRAPRGLVLIPTEEDPAAIYVFPNAELSGIASGLGQFRLDPAGAGQVVLRDAAGRETQLQLGASAGKSLMRVRPPGQTQARLFVGCAPTTR